MHSGIISMVVVFLIVTPTLAENRDKPEAVQMFERLIQRIPSGTDAHDIHKYIGKDFTYVYNAGNAAQVGVQWTPFWISNRLFCVHCVQSKTPTITVYEIITPNLKSKPFSEIAQRAYGQFKSLRKQRGFAQVLDLHAAIDHNTKLTPEQLTYKKIYPLKP